MAFLVLGANSVSGYTVKNSLRFNSGSSDHLTITPASSSNRQVWTYSAWVKRSTLGNKIIFSAGSNVNVYSYIGFTSSDQLEFVSYQFGTTGQLTTTQLFRDVSAWYHIVFALDTTNSTADDRMKFWVNGTQITSFASRSNPTLNGALVLPQTSTQQSVGRENSATNRYFDGYIAENYLIDQTALTPSSFGQTDTDTGIWIPKAYTGTYGTNGFYLKFANSASLGTDSSGNGNNFTVNNLTSVDQTTDTPTNNFATMNPLDNKTGGTYSDGNLKLTDGSNDVATRSTIAVDKGKWYWETQWTYSSGSGSQAIYFGILDTVAQIDTGSNVNTNTALFSVIYNPNGGGLYKNGTSVGSSYAGSVNSIFGFKLDLDNGNLYIHENGTYYNSGNAVVTGITSGKTYSPYFAPNAGATDSMAIANFGNPPYSANSYTDSAGYGNFSYSVPSGYYALCTKNLANYG